MLPTRAALLGAPLLLIAGCSQLQLASAGQTACAPKEIQISDVERGWSSESWVATCGGKRFRCSSLSTAWSVDYSCKLEGEPSIPDGAERAPAAPDATSETAPADSAAETASPGGDAEVSESATDSTTGEESSAQDDAPGDDTLGEDATPEADATTEPGGGDDHP